MYTCTGDNVPIYTNGKGVLKMELYDFFKSIIDMDNCPVVICSNSHEIIYMNPAAADRYAKRGGAALIGKSLLDCHNEESNKRIKQVVEWFGKSPDNNRVFTFHNDRENRDVYMIALRNGSGELIGYYEKHERRDREKEGFYVMD